MSGPRTQLTEIRAYKRHKKNIENATSKVDNAAPQLPIRIYINPGKLYDDMFRLMQIEKHNRELLKQINIINRTKGRIDCYQTKHIKIKPKFLMRQIEQKADEDRNTKLLKSIKDKLHSSDYSQDVLLPDWKKNLKSMIFSSRFKDFYKKKVTDWSICPLGITSNPSLRKTCFFDILVGDLKTRMYIEIYADIVPISAKNFISLCTGQSNYSYKNSLFFRIIPSMFCLGGDVENFNGTGGASIYGNNFMDNNYILQHNGPGVVAMYSNFPTLNDSKFLITFKKLPTLNSRYVVIGRVVKSLKALNLIEDCGSRSGKPYSKVIITNSGVC